MPWVRLDDAFADHEKILAAGPLAGWLWVCGLAYSNRNGTDGRIPRQKLNGLVDYDGIGVYAGNYTGDDVDVRRLAEQLVDVGLWEPLPDGSWLIHDYDEYQLTTDELEKRRASKAAAGKKGADKRWGTSDGTCYGTCYGTSHGGTDDTNMARTRTRSLNPPPSVSGDDQVLTGEPVDNESEEVPLGPVWEQIAVWALDERAKKSHLEPIRDRKRWLARAASKAEEDYGPAVPEILRGWAITESKLLAEVLTGKRDKRNLGHLRRAS